MTDPHAPRNVTVQLNPALGRVAHFSVDQKYRYDLLSKLDVGEQASMFPTSPTPPRPEGRSVLWIMLNPSSATAFRDDPTVARVRRRSVAAGFTTLAVCNLFAYRATEARVLLDVDDPIGPLNDAIIAHRAREADQVVVAWGSFHPDVREGRAEEVAALLRAVDRPPVCLGTTRAGHPRHPLYVPYSQTFEPWEAP